MFMLPAISGKPMAEAWAARIFAQVDFLITRFTA